MQTHPQRGQPSSAGDRIGRRRPGHHQTGRSQDTFAVSRFHGFVDRKRGSEIIRRDDELLQAASRRERRKWKNSTPSRSRRPIISGLAIISATMEAILLGRR